MCCQQGYELIYTWIYHGTSRLKLAHVQLASNCNEWLFQEVQGRVSQLKLLFIIVAVVSLRAIFSMHYVCGKYITTYKKCTFFIYFHIDTHIKMSMCMYADIHSSKLEYPLQMSQAAGVWNQWNGMVEWTTGMECWN